jgi:serine/threonine protein kinase
MAHKPSIVMKPTDVNDILDDIKIETPLGKGAAGTVYRLNYYTIPAVVKVPNSPDKEASLKAEIIIYQYLCKIFNQCVCQTHIVQLLGYDMNRAIMILEYFDGSDLVRYTGYPMHPSTFLTHRLQPRTSSNTPDIGTLKTYLHTNTMEDTIWSLFNNVYTGLLCLHGRAVLHRDLELKNILISSSGKVGITDFGLSQIINHKLLSTGAQGLMAAFRRDLASVGPMMGDFLDIDNVEPYQYRLERGPIINRPILNKLTSVKLKDAFLLLTSFREIAVFVSFVYYLTNHLDFETSREFITSLVESANDSIEEKIPEEQRGQWYIYESELEFIMNTIYNPLIVEPGFMELAAYFRHVIAVLFRGIGLNDPIGEKESVHDYITRHFPSDYDLAITSLSDQIEYGVLLKHFNLFTDAYHD